MTLPSPYYSDEHCTIYHADCRDVLPYLEPVDLVLTDPPYNVGIDYGEHNDNMSREDFITWASGWFHQCRSLSRSLLITGQARLPDYAAIEPWKWLLCWHKPAAMGRSPVGFCNWEPVALWGDGGKNGCDVVRAVIKPSKQIDGHPCPKPLNWARGLLGLFPEHKRVCDPFVGSGTVLVAAKMEGREAIGIEIEEAYCKISADRVKSTDVGFGLRSSPKTTIDPGFGLRATARKKPRR